MEELPAEREINIPLHIKDVFSDEQVVSGQTMANFDTQLVIQLHAFDSKNNKALIG